MPIHLPNIEGTAHDFVLNEFIDFVNSEARPERAKFAAHAAAAIGKFLIENHEVEAGSRWIQKAMPLVQHITITPLMVDKLYQPLVERSKQTRKSGYAKVAMTLIVIAVVAGIAWWWFSK